MRDKANILVVEDEAPMAMMMVYLLTRAGCDVQTAWNAEAALRLACTGEFDLITLDIDLPGMNGFEVCRRLKENASLHHTPVVFVSGRHGHEDQEHAFKLGAVDYIAKPFEPADFILRIISRIRVKRTGHRLAAEKPRA